MIPKKWSLEFFLKTIDLKKNITTRSKTRENHLVVISKDRFSIRIIPLDQWRDYYTNERHHSGRRK
jgi:hypothetical protein